MKLKNFTFILILLISVFTLSACTTDEPSNRTTNLSVEDTIEMTIYAYDGKGESFFGVMNLGHSFLGFKNLGTEQIIIGDYVLNPDEEITIGTWCIQDYFGVWYNIESNYIAYYDKYNGRKSVTTHINVDKVDDLNLFIDKNDTWLPTKNCTNFSIGLWNSVVGNTEKLKTHTIYTPTKLQNSLDKFVSVQTNKSISVNPDIGYFKNKTFVKFSMQEV